MPRLTGRGPRPSFEGMDSKTDILERLASRLKQTRTSKGLSLDALAKLSGVSRSMLSQIERGESSPTVATLWNLSRALQMDLSGLLEGEEEEQSAIEEVLRADRTPAIDSKREGWQIRILSPPSQTEIHEIYDVYLRKGGALVSEPHRQGCREHLTVIEGSVAVTSDGTDVELEEGDTVRYAADCPHAIRARNGAARAILVVQYD